MPSADFCPAVRLPLDNLSPSRTQDRSPGVSSAAFHAQPPDLRSFAPLMDMDFAVSCPLVRRWRLLSGFCSSTRMFALRFFQTPPRGDSPCVLTSPSPPSGWAGDLHPQAAEHAQHTTKPLRGICLRFEVLRFAVGWSEAPAKLGSGLFRNRPIQISRNPRMTPLRQRMLDD